jgi:hypothetical protein
MFVDWSLGATSGARDPTVNSVYAQVHCYLGFRFVSDRRVHAPSIKIRGLR